LELNVYTSDNQTAPGRDGRTKAFASGCSRVLSRETKYGATTISYTTPPSPTEPAPIPSAINPKVLITPPYKKALIDLSYNCSLFDISDRARVEAKKKVGKSVMDQFAHDRPSMTYCSADLIKKNKQTKEVTAIWNMFIVVMPIRLLTPSFCRDLMKVYDVSIALGHPGMNFSVYFMGCKTNRPDYEYANMMGHLAATAVFRRLQLFQKIYSGYVDDTDLWVLHQHALLQKAAYVHAIAKRCPDDFVSNFAKAKVESDSMGIVHTYKPQVVDLRNLSGDREEEDNVSAGVAWD